jgi:hypothetical protein
LYINDIASISSNFKVKLFADDTNIFIFGSNLQELNRNLVMFIKILEKWFLSNKLTVNLDKTCYTLFSSTGVNDCKFDVLFYNKRVPYVDNCKYLGIIIDSRLKWDAHIDSLYTSLLKFPSVFFKLRTIIPKDSLKMIYYALVHSKILYGIEAYGVANSTCLKKLIVLNNKILRILQFRKLDCPIKDLYVQYNTLPVPALYDYQILSFMFKYNHHSNVLPSAFNNFFVLNKNVHNYQTRNSNNFHCQMTASRIGNCSLSHRGTHLWNSLPETLKSKTSVNIFQHNLKKYLLDKYFEN